jgi:hypothetical protein
MPNEPRGAGWQSNPHEGRYPPSPWSTTAPPAGMPTNPPPQPYETGWPPPPHPGPFTPPSPQPYSPNGPWQGYNLAPPALGMPPGAAGWGPVGPRQPARRWWLLGAFAIFVVGAVIAAVVIVTSGSGSQSTTQRATMTTTTATTTTVPPVPVSAMDQLLPSPAEVADAVSAPALLDQTTPDQSHAFSSDHVVDSDCLGVVYPGMQQFYEGSGWESTRVQNLADTNDQHAKKFGITDAVIAFPDAATATKFYHRAVKVFYTCANRNVNMHSNDDPNGNNGFWAIGPVSETDGVLSTSAAQEGEDGWNTQRRLSVRRNVLIDIGAAGYDMPDTASKRLLKIIADQVDSVS